MISSPLVAIASLGLNNITSREQGLNRSSKSLCNVYECAYDIGRECAFDHMCTMCYYVTIRATKVLLGAASEDALALRGTRTLPRVVDGCHLRNRKRLLKAKHSFPVRRKHRAWDSCLLHGYIVMRTVTV